MGYWLLALLSEALRPLFICHAITLLHIPHLGSRRLAGRVTKDTPMTIIGHLAYDYDFMHSADMTDGLKVCIKMLFYSNAFRILQSYHSPLRDLLECQI